MAADEDRRREIQQLRGDIAVLRVRLNVELGRGGERRLIVAISELLQEKRAQLEEIESSPGEVKKGFRALPARNPHRVVAGIDEVEQIRDDIRVLRVVIDAVLDNGPDERMLRACAAVLRDRQELLAWFEAEE